MLLVLLPLLLLLLLLLLPSSSMCTGLAICTASTLARNAG